MIGKWIVGMPYYLSTAIEKSPRLVLRGCRFMIFVLSLWAFSVGLGFGIAFGSYLLVGK